MISPQKTLAQLSDCHSFTGLFASNRYCLAAETKPGRMSCYYFSTPIRKKSDGKIVNGQFQVSNNGYLFAGSNGTVRIFGNRITFMGPYGDFQVAFARPQPHFHLTADRRSLRTEYMTFYPTYNGILIQELIKPSSDVSFRILTDLKATPQSNSKYFTFMKEKFEPYFTVNAMFAENRYGNVFYNIRLSVEKISEHCFEVRIKSEDHHAYKLTYVLNLYEPKLIQDTTVEEHRPDENNVYGNVAFLGQSPDCGRQMLYSRIDTSKLADIKGYCMQSVRLYIPYYMTAREDFSLYAPFRRFCSFGSNWSNRIPFSDLGLKGIRQNGFLSFDLSGYMLTNTGSWKENEGIVLRSGEAKQNFSILATADNDFTPQILEIQYKKGDSKNEI